MNITKSLCFALTGDYFYYYYFKVYEVLIVALLDGWVVDLFGIN